MKTCYYYQTFVGLDKIKSNLNSTDVIIVSSLHFGEKQYQNNIKSYINLNDNSPDDKIFSKMWKETGDLSISKTIMIMMGGAGGAYNYFFKNFDECYDLLVDFLKKRPFIKGIDLDIEENVIIDNVKKLINKLVNDFGTDFIITMAPVGNSLQNDSPGMGGFIYKNLYKSNEGKYIHWFNTQCYGGSFNFNTFDSIVKNGYPESKIVMGMMSGDFSKNTFKNALDEISKIKKKYPNFGGVFDWEYLDAPPDNNDPSKWGELIKSIK